MEPPFLVNFKNSNPPFYEGRVSMFKLNKIAEIMLKKSCRTDDIRIIKCGSEVENLYHTKNLLKYHPNDYK